MAFFLFFRMIFVRHAFFLFACLLLLSPKPLQSQNDWIFKPDPTSLQEGFTTIFGNRDPAAAKAILEDFTKQIKQGGIEENQLIDLAELANQLRVREAQPFPHFHDLLKTWLLLTRDPSATSNYLVWTSYIRQVLQAGNMPLNQLSSFLDFCLGFLDNKVLIRKNAFLWKLEGGSFRFEQIPDFRVAFNSSSLIGQSTSGKVGIEIKSTSGSYDPLSQSLDRSGGRVTWERSGLSPDEVHADLPSYQLDLNRGIYEIDTVLLFDNRYFDHPVTGKLEDKILPGIAPERAGYPRFTSYHLSNRIKEVYPGMDYRGGYTLQGNQVIGSGSPDMKSELLVYRNNLPVLRLASTYFVLARDRARGLNTEASIYLGEDSVFHPGLLFQYNHAKREIALIRDGEGLSNSRYFNSYHRVDFDVKFMRWIVGDSLMTFSGMIGSIENRATFESSDYFSIDRFNEILLLDKKHPLALVKGCADFLHTNYYRSGDLADFMVKPIHLVEEMLLNLTFLGFVRFNSQTKQVEVTQKTYDFLEKHAGLQDYDIIRFESLCEPPAANAIVNLNSRDLTVFYVDEVKLSSTRNVSFYPDNQTVIIKKGLNMLFSGAVRGGLLDFDGNDFEFDYNGFALRMHKINNITIHVYEDYDDPERLPKLVPVSSIIENTSGTLQIDHPEHKSGLEPEKLPQYPLLITDSSAYVYYDQPDILNGIYKRDSFYFQIHPFLLDSLNDMRLAEVLSFNGSFVTSSIFPPLELILSHQKDHSLGFDTVRTPPQGLPVYRGKGIYFDRLGMSRAGLRGSGRLEYLNATLESDDFLFLPERVITTARTFAVKQEERAESSPESFGKELSVEWNPQQERMVASGDDNPLSIYGEVEFDGDLLVEPSGLKGKGTLKMAGFEISSDDFTFFKESFEAKNSSYKLFNQSDSSKASSDAKTIALSARGFDAKVNFKRSEAIFENASQNGRISFTDLQYEAAAGQFIWNLNNNEISTGEAIFTSQHPRQESLSWKSNSGLYDPDKKSFDAKGVSYIDVADVRIFPDQESLTLKTAAEIETLNNAVLVSKDTTHHHRIVDASVSIRSASSYQASGTYLYRDLAQREFKIRLEDISVKSGLSSGTGMIAETSGFYLSPAFQYSGQATWLNNQPYIEFDGAVKLEYNCPDITREWIAFKNFINPDSVLIPIDSVTLSSERNRMYKGFYLSNQPVELYSTFLGPHLRYSDQALISAFGWLWYDAGNNQFMIGSNEKVKDPESDGPLLILDRNSCQTRGEGVINTGVDLGQMKLSSAGTIIHDLNLDTLKLDVILAMDFFMNEKAMDVMTKTLNQSNTALPVNYASEQFKKNFSRWLGRTRANELLNQLGLLGRWRKVPDEMNHTILFTELQLVWDPVSGSYRSIGPLGIANIGGEAVNKKINGHLEITHRRGGDNLTLYLEPEKDQWFYFNYSRGLLQVLAGPKAEKFNELVRNTKEAKRKQETEAGQATYQYFLGQYRLVRDFLDRVSGE